MAETAAPAKAKKTAKARKPSAHPKYSEMITAAINSDSGRKGLSRQSIQKYVRDTYKVGNNADVQVKMALKKMVSQGALTHASGSGVSGSFRFNRTPAKKAAKPKPAKATQAKKTAAKAAKPKMVAKPKKVTKSPAKSKKPKSPAKAAKKSPKKAAAKTKAATPKKVIKAASKAKPKAKAKPAKKAAKGKAKPAKKAAKK